MEFEPVIGLEVHVQLDTKSKLFSPSPHKFDQPANSQAHVVDLGLPGTLPVTNHKAIEYAILFGLAINAEISSTTVFARKNYFYPDLAKGYQISQLEAPIVNAGYIYIQDENNKRKRISITRAHLEEDAGKLIHVDNDHSLVDFNRAGTPLLEIVSDPVIESAQQASAYLKKINALIRYLGISDGDLSQGSMRCDANVSIRPKGSSTLGTRTELKNINSYRFVERAIQTEILRQTALIRDGKKVIQETRLYNSVANTTKSMRSKEEANDYRYFPDPDLLPVQISSQTIEKLRAKIGELPDDRQARYIEKLGLAANDAKQIVEDPGTTNFFEAIVASCFEYKLAANWLLVELGGMLNKKELTIQHSPITPKHIADLVSEVNKQKISGKIGKRILETLFDKPNLSVTEIINQQGLTQMTSVDELAKIVDKVFAANTDQVTLFKQAPENKQKRMLGFFIGKIMQQTKGKANPKAINEIVLNKLRGR